MTIRNFIIIFVLFSISANLFAQSTGKNPLRIEIEPIEINGENIEILSKVDPKYKNGNFEDLRKSIFLQLQYPNEDCIEGVTILTFEINESGEIENIIMKRSISDKINSQLLSLIKKYKFEPGKINGINWAFRISIPFRIKLE